ncbi:c-5 sterol desaturase [Sarracenia purpurea var. burkii]
MKTKTKGTKQLPLESGHIYSPCTHLRTIVEREIQRDTEGSLDSDRSSTSTDSFGDPKMPRGTLEVLLVGAKGLENTDFFCNMDPYALINCRTQEQKSSVATDAGSTPEWNETFVFTISEGVSELTIKLMDKDTFSSDDFVGEATIPLEPVFLEGSIPPTSYNVVKDQEFCGEVKVGLIFTQQRGSDLGFDGEEEENYGGWKDSRGSGREFDREEESFGGWKESSID